MNLSVVMICHTEFYVFKSNIFVPVFDDFFSKTCQNQVAVSLEPAKMAVKTKKWRLAQKVIPL
jgi:hypothetical protein